MKSIWLIIFIGLGINVFGQLSEADQANIQNYKTAINSDIHDTLKIQAIQEWNNLTYLSDPQLDLELNIKIDSICSLHLANEVSPQEQQFYLHAKANAANIIGVNSYYSGQYDEAISFYKVSHDMHQQLNNLSGQANALNNVGVVHFRCSKYEEALKYYRKGLALRLEAADTIGIAGSYRNIASVYQNKGDFMTAIKLLDKEKNLNTLIKDSVSIATSLLEMGTIYFDLQDYEKTFSYFNQAKDILEKHKVIRELPRVYNGIGACYEKTQKYDSAHYFYDLCIDIAEQYQDPHYVSMAKNNKSFIFFLQGLETEAEICVKEAMNIAESGGDINGYLTAKVSLSKLYIKQSKFAEAEKLVHQVLLAMDTIDIDVNGQMNVYEALYAANKGLNRYEKALNFHEKFIERKDSLINSVNQKLLMQKEFNAQSRADSLRSADLIKIKNIELSAQKTENEKQKQKGYFLIVGSVLLIVFAGFMFNRYRITKRQNQIISEQKKLAEHQKEIIQEAHQEITDSIAYAKRIQSAILPPRKLVQELLPNSFVLYKPKDVVAGDFYWMEKVGNTTLFAAADCTGHGVPGAMVSVVCNNALNRAVREFRLVDPAQILNKVREIVIQEFEKSEEEVKDGMDIALCALNGNSLQYAGAHNPLWIVRNNEMIEIKADKQPIGKFEKASPFTSHKLDLQKGDSIYVFSDGYVDQFGGEKGKKFKPKALRALLLNLQNHPLSKQSNILDKAIENWRGELEQVDDICFIGVKIDEPTSI